MLIWFRFDWFFRSRTPDELKRRAATLMLCIMKDKEPVEEKEFKPKGGSKVGSSRSSKGNRS